MLQFHYIIFKAILLFSFTVFQFWHVDLNKILLSCNISHENTAQFLQPQKPELC